MHMFCFQCQETSDRRGCTTGGMCGKSEETANYQDLLIYVLKGLGLAVRAGAPIDREVAAFVFEALYATVTNTNFDPQRILTYVRRGLELKRRLVSGLTEEQRAALPEAARFDETSESQLRAKAYLVGVLQTEDADVRSLRELITYALKGISAYATHALLLGHERPQIADFTLKALAAVPTETSLEALLEVALQTGAATVETMELLDRANAAVYGEPRATRFSIGVRGRPGILVSGHDLKDIEELLVQTQGTGVDVYTHGEMISAHYYPKLKSYEHLAGNYGGAWWRQDVEFAQFNGPVLMTSNCIIPVKDSYKDRLFTTGVAGYPEIRHLSTHRPDGAKDFSDLIALARRCPPPQPIDQGEKVGGFTHGQLMEHAEKLLGLVKAGRVKRFVVIGGCDGRELSREYYRQLAEKLPQDTLILTAGCTKYMFFKLDLGEIDGIPRVLDAGQCNDCYSLVAFALKLQKVLGLADPNQLPLSINVAWYDQKAVAVLLALLHLGFKSFRLGPTLPAFLSPK
ncbi:MAG: hydroxylamine reductase, partial [Deltaproteobacteria bacterium]|nr:hydroxylamine reductase [Deltaproteobacteria bacterium]